MPDPKEQNKKNKKEKRMGAQAEKSKVTKPLKRGDRRPDGSIVGGIAGATKPKKPSKNKAPKAPKNEIDKTTGKKYDDSENGRKARLAREKAAGMRDKMGYQTSSYESGGAAPKNLGTVSDGTPFYKRGPLFAHEAGHIDPTKEAKAKAEAKKKAETNASTAKKVYGKSSTNVENIVTPGGNVRGTRTTVTTPYTQSGTGNAKFNTAYGAAKKAGKKTFDYGGKSIKVEDAASKSGKDVRSTVNINKISGTTLKPVGIKFTPTLPTADITIPKVPKKSKPPMPTFSMSKGRSGGGTTKLIDFNNNRVRKTKAGSGNSCGCK